MTNLYKVNYDKNRVRLDISRSTFKMNPDFLGTASAGDLNVCLCQEVLPGDSWKLIAKTNARMATPIHPVFSKAWINVEFFFIPWRLVWEHWEEFLGVNKDTFWAQTTTYSIPYLTAPTGGFQEGTLADQMGIPINVGGIKVNALPFRAYALTYNYYWRNKNVMNPCGINFDDTNRTGSNGSNYITDCQLGGKPAKACKLGDPFTRALPSPQKGPSVTLPLGSSAWVYTGTTEQTWSGGRAPLKYKKSDGTTTGLGDQTTGIDSSRGVASGVSYTYSGTGFGLTPSNLYVDLENATASTVNQLRLSFATQRILEAQARAGCSYQELLQGLYDVTAGDARLQMPEFLGGAKVPVMMSQVLQTSSTDSTTPQGNTAAYSQTLTSAPRFHRSFVEHGLLLGLYTIRNENLYQQGIPKLFTKRSKYDIYWPQLANIGEQALPNALIYATGTSSDDGVFGYQEAWWEYRDIPNMVTGQFRSTYSAPLDSWHYGDHYSALPTLTSNFVMANGQNIARSLAVQTGPQFLVDMHFDITATRPMPIDSIPGLIDHH